jgi:hypothetical protein
LVAELERDAAGGRPARSDDAGHGVGDRRLASPLTMKEAPLVERGDELVRSSASAISHSPRPSLQNRTSSWSRGGRR